MIAFGCGPLLERGHIMDGGYRYLYMQIYQELRQRIHDGVYRDGDKLPTEFELMQSYGASRDTVRKAMRLLTQEDYVIRVTAKGTFVRYNKSQVNVTRMLGFTDMMEANNRKPSAKVLDVSLLSDVSQDILDSLHLSSLHKVYRIARLRYMDGDLISLELAHVPYILCPELERYITPHASLYNLYQSVYQLELGRSSVSLCATLPVPKVAELLQISTSTPILQA
ncbi:GntR family transcriptional regulator, partial [Akkermansia muciniphila]